MNTTNLCIPSNKVRDIERYILEQLTPQYPEGEVRQFSRMLFESFLGWDTVAFLLHRDGTINQSDLLRFHWAVEDLKKYRPIQHIIGYADFCDCRFAVGPEVLIPRQETEEIVTNILMTESKYLADKEILDFCTGSGCIAISLSKHMPSAKVSAVDLSTEALAKAKENNEANNASVAFYLADVLNPTELPVELLQKKYGLIISNPPYVMKREAAQMQPNVLDYEPSMALWVEDDDPLIFYEAIARFSDNHLLTDGLLVFEINENLAKETSRLLIRYGFKPQVVQDFRGKDRCIIARR